MYRDKPTTGKDRYDKHYDPRGLVLVDFGIARRWWLNGIEDPPSELSPKEIALEEQRQRESALRENVKDEDSEGNGIMMTRFCGSPLWMAPEIVKGAGYGREVDMWSFGVIVYGMLTGVQSPVPGLSAEGKNYLPLLKPPRDGIEYPEQLSENAKEFLKGLLCWNPKERVTAGMALEHPWISNIVGGDWLRWEKLVRKWTADAGKRRRERIAAKETEKEAALAGSSETVERMLSNSARSMSETDLVRRGSATSANSGTNDYSRRPSMHVEVIRRPSVNIDLLRRPSMPVLAFDLEDWKVRSWEEIVALADEEKAGTASSQNENV